MCPPVKLLGAIQFKSKEQEVLLSGSHPSDYTGVSFTDSQVRTTLNSATGTVLLSDSHQ